MIKKSLFKYLSIQSVRTLIAINLDQLYGGFSYQSIPLVSVLFILNNQDPFQDAEKKDLEKITLKITNRQNLAQALYVSKISSKSHVGQGFTRNYEAEEFAEMDNYAISLAELGAVLLQKTSRWRREKFSDCI
jgi:hypothetical protein